MALVAPVVTSVTVPITQQNTSGLVVTQGVADTGTAFVVASGPGAQWRLFKHDGTTELFLNSEFSHAEGLAGLKLQSNASVPLGVLPVAAVYFASIMTGVPGTQSGAVTPAVTVTCAKPTFSPSSKTGAGSATAGNPVTIAFVDDGSGTTQDLLYAVTGAPLDVPLESLGGSQINEGEWDDRFVSQAGFRINPSGEIHGTFSVTWIAGSDAGGSDQSPSRTFNFDINYLPPAWGGGGALDATVGVATTMPPLSRDAADASDPAGYIKYVPDPSTVIKDGAGLLVPLNAYVQISAYTNLLTAHTATCSAPGSPTIVAYLAKDGSGTAASTGATLTITVTTTARLAQWNQAALRMSITGASDLVAAAPVITFNNGTTTYTYDSMVVDGTRTVIVQLVAGGVSPGSGVCRIGLGSFTSVDATDLVAVAIPQNTPSMDTVMTALGATGYWKCNDANATLAATAGSAGSIVGSPTLGAVGGLWNEPYGGKAITLANAKYLRTPTGSWFPSIGTGIWGSCVFRNSTTYAQICGSYNGAAPTNGLGVTCGYDYVAAAVNTSRLSVSALDAAGKEIANTYYFDEVLPRWRDGDEHTLTWHIAGGKDGVTAAVIRLWFDGTELTAVSTKRQAGYDFTTGLSNLSGDLVWGGYVINGGYASANTGITMQRLGIGTGLPSAANISNHSLCLWYVDALGMRKTADHVPHPDYCFTDDLFTSKLSALTTPTGSNTATFGTERMRRCIDQSGNGFHLIPNPFAVADAACPNDGLPVLRRDPQGVYAFQIHNIFGTVTWVGEPEFRYTAMTLDNGIGGTCIEALLNVSAVLGAIDTALYQSGEQRLFTLSSGVFKGSAAIVAGKPRLKTTDTGRTQPATPFPVVRCDPTISLVAWCGGGDGHRLLEGTNTFFVDGAIKVGNDNTPAGTYDSGEPIGGSTYWAFEGGEANSGADGFAGVVYRQGMSACPHTPSELAAAWTAHKALLGIVDPPTAVINVSGDSITEQNLSILQHGWEQRLLPGGVNTSWRSVALYVHATPGIKLSNALGGNSIQDVSWLLDSDIAYGLTSATRFSFFWFLGTNDVSAGEDPSLSLGVYANAVAAALTIVPLGAFVQNVAGTIPTLGQGPSATRTGINAGLTSRFDRVVTTHDYEVYVKGGNVVHPDDAGMQNIADDWNHAGSNPLGWALASVATATSGLRGRNLGRIESGSLRNRNI